MQSCNIGKRIFNPRRIIWKIWRNKKMKILLIQPGFGHGLGFQRVALVEPLGLETVAATLLAEGHNVTSVSLI
jgi:hypothetical protein